MTGILQLLELLAILGCVWFPTIIGQGYSKDDLNYLADEMLKDFNSLPTLEYKKQCANPTKDPNTNPFFKYVINIHEELNTANDPDGFYIRNGYTFLRAWEDYGGWKCHSHLQCTQLDDHDMREKDKDNWVIWYECKCGATVIEENGVTTTYPSHPVDENAVPIQCKYDMPNSHCSASSYEILCYEPDYLCLVDEFNVNCDPANEKYLQDYLADHSIPRRSNDCKCRPSSELVPEWRLDQPWSTREYIVENKKLGLLDEKCANLSGLIGDVRAKYITGKYRLPDQAKVEFDALKSNPDVTTCDESRELSCDFGNANPGTDHFGTCKCNPVPEKTGWFADQTKPVTVDGFCALQSDSDCSTGIDNFFKCHEPENCLIELCNVECSPANLKEVHNTPCLEDLKWEGNKTAGNKPEEERFVKRCHCKTGDKAYKTFGERKKAMDKFTKKQPIFDLGYGSNKSNNLRNGRLLMEILCLSIVLFLYI